MPHKIQIRLASQRVNTSVSLNQRYPKIFTPGETITAQNEFMRFALKNKYKNTQITALY